MIGHYTSVCKSGEKRTEERIDRDGMRNMYNYGGYKLVAKGPCPTQE